MKLQGTKARRHEGTKWWNGRFAAGLSLVSALADLLFTPCLRASVPPCLPRARRHEGTKWLALLAMLVVAGVARAEGEWRLDDELHYVIEMGGARAGEMVLRIESDGERYRTRTDMDMRLRRGPIEIGIEMSSTFVETTAGAPLEMEMRQKLASQPVATRYVFEGDQVRVTTRQAGRETEELQPAPPTPWLTPMAVHRLWLGKLAGDAESFSYATIDGQLGLQPVEFTHVRVGREMAEVNGAEAVPVTVFETTTSLLPTKGTDKYTDDGTLVYQETNMGVGSMVLRLVSAEEARAVAGGPAPELLIETFVEPNGRFADVRHASKAVLRLRVRDGDMPELPAAGAQRVRRVDGRTLELTIDVDDALPAPPGDERDDAYTRASGMIDADDPLVRRLAERYGEGATPAERAEALRSAVRRLVEDKGLDTAFATASEVARLRRGDCSEHAVLLCALLRAAGIPARVAIGLVYADQFMGHDAIFGWHMWTQGLIDGRWVDFDATLPQRYHAGHVLTATSALAEGAVDTQLAATLMLMGNLEIDIEGVNAE